MGNGLTLKAGKFATLIGYEVNESPNNLNFSRDYPYTLAIPLTHTVGLASYMFTDWFNMTAGVVLGWDDSKNVNDVLSYTGQFAFTPLKDFTTRKLQLDRRAGQQGPPPADRRERHAGCPDVRGGSTRG